MTDGPYLEAKEFVSSFFILDCEGRGAGAGNRRRVPVRSAQGSGRLAGPARGRAGNVNEGDQASRTSGGNVTPQVLGALLRRHGNWEMCEDALQEALLEVSDEWERNGVPEQPRASGHRGEPEDDRSNPQRIGSSGSRGAHPGGRTSGQFAANSRRGEDIDRDDSLLLLFMCCHPALSAPSQIALTLRSIGGRATGEIAGTFFVPESTMAQRISRAKQRMREVGAIVLDAGSRRCGDARAASYTTCSTSSSMRVTPLIGSGDSSCRPHERSDSPHSELRNAATTRRRRGCWL